jgi:AcrR family transcriptional regulator
MHIASALICYEHFAHLFIMPIAARNQLETVKRRIESAARQRFESFGYRRTTIAEIARDSGIAVGTVYLHFKNKEEILVALIEGAASAWMVEAQRTLEGPGSPAERLDRLSEISAQHSRGDKLIRSILDRNPEIILVPLLEPINRKLTRQNVELLSAVIREGIRNGSFRKVDPEQTAFILFSTGQMLFHQDLFPYPEIQPLMREITMHGLLRHDVRSRR